MLDGLSTKSGSANYTASGSWNACGRIRQRTRRICAAHEYARQYYWQYGAARLSIQNEYTFTQLSLPLGGLFVEVRRDAVVKLSLPQVALRRIVAFFRGGPYHFGLRDFWCTQGISLSN
jgi:hypothetical protein